MSSRRLALVVTALVALSAAPPAGAGTNPQVAGLQTALRAKGLYTGAIDGVAGPQTAAAVRAFQRRAGLVVDGIAGIHTRTALGPLGRPLLGRRIVKRDAVGWDVSVLQFLLRRAGTYGGAIDGRFGPRTRAALVRYQRRAGLVPDGLAGPATLGILDPTGRAAPPQVARPRTIADSMSHWSRHYGVDARLVRALAWQESGHQNHVVSAAGALGVMQVTPATWDFVEEVLVGRAIAHTADGNVRVGVAFLAHLLRQFEGDERLALAAYYRGPAAVRRYGVGPETRRYVANVLALRSRM
ncbi:MAG TPA: peptidoglycan-binding protein [Gaiellaceae bacterium]|nr:peptidoglycan-binding protein [Gaiellaceae bacterium]